MQLLIVRHADAGDSEEFAKTGRPDSERPLSSKGKDQIRRVAAGLLTLVPSCDAIISSPYARAAETAEILRHAYGMAGVALTETLEPESPPNAFERWLRTQPPRDVLVIVGHEPHLGALASWFATGSRTGDIEFKKAGACLLAFSGAPVKGGGALRWMKGPKELAALGVHGQ